MKGYDEPSFEEIDGAYKPKEVDEKITLALSLEEIKKIIEEENLTQLNGHKIDGTFGIMNELKGKVYLRDIYNHPEKLKGELIRKNMELEEMFPRLFWEEYVHKAEFGYEGTYKEYEDKISEFGVIKKILDDNPQIHGKTGAIKQEENLDIKYFNKSFSMRAWGALMAAYMNTKLKERKYHYMDFYM